MLNSLVVSTVESDFTNKLDNDDISLMHFPINKLGVNNILIRLKFATYIFNSYKQIFYFIFCIHIYFQLLRSVMCKPHWSTIFVLYFTNIQSVSRRCDEFTLITQVKLPNCQFGSGERVFFLPRPGNISKFASPLRTFFQNNYSSCHARVKIF